MILCSRCSRHLRGGARTCPFCGAAQTIAAPSSAALILAAGLALAGCTGDDKSGDDGTITVAAYAGPAVTSEDVASASASTTTSTTDDTATSMTDSTTATESGTTTDTDTDTDTDTETETDTDTDTGTGSTTAIDSLR